MRRSSWRGFIATVAMKPRHELRRISPYAPPYGEISETHGPAFARPAARSAAVEWGSTPEASAVVLSLGAAEVLGSSSEAPAGRFFKSF